MPDQDERPANLGGAQAPVEIACDRRAVAGQGAGIGEAVACAVVGADTQLALETRAHARPGQGIRAEAAFQDDGRSAGAAAAEIQSPAVRQARDLAGRGFRVLWRRVLGPGRLDRGRAEGDEQVGDDQQTHDPVAVPF